tara:strand:+ start:824 stop:1342 length:519 start_codon:yes stop_codon:yes gene_type:complete
MGNKQPTFTEREASAGLYGTTAGRDDFYSNLSEPQAPWASFDSSEMLAGSPMDFKADVPAGSSVELYSFKIIDDGDGTVSVTTGTVNTATATGLTPSGKPTQLWLKATFDTDGAVTGASVTTSSGSTSETADYRQIASITWSADVPTIAQGIKGSQSIASCGATHQWGTLYT